MWTMMARTLTADKRLEAVMRLLALLPAILLLALVLTLVSLTPARAAEDPACGGKDLLADLKARDPAAWQAFMDQAKTIRHGDSIFFRIERDGIAPSWLLGTYHVTDPRVTGMPEAARAPFAEASTLIVETDEILDQQGAALKLLARPDLMMFPAKETIRDYLSDEEEKLLSEGLIKRGIPLMSVIKMRPWLISSMMALSSCELARKARGTPFLDMKLAQDAKAAGKEVVGLETMAEQLTAMADMPIEFHVKSLVSIVRHQDFVIDMMETVTRLYLDGKASLVLPATIAFNPDKSESDASDMARFEQRLIIDRNHIMAERAAPVLARGNVFMAVGAAHLYGDEGIVALLEGQGFRLTAVPVAIVPGAP